MALYNYSGAFATLWGGSFTARGGTSNARGIHNFGTGTTLEAANVTTLEAANVTALGEDGGNINSGLYNASSASATLRGGSFTARAGVLPLPSRA